MKGVTVGTYSLQAEAHLAKSALAFNGIEAWLENEYLNATAESLRPASSTAQ